jgi:hypothetical protein
MDGGDWANAGAMGGYAASADGKMLTGAFVQAYNALVAQRGALAPASASASGAAGSR